MDAAGMGVPSAALAVKGSTVAWSFGVGMLVTLVASIAPAVRASRVPPIAALRDTAHRRVGRVEGAARVRVPCSPLFGVALVIAGADRRGASVSPGSARSSRSWASSCSVPSWPGPRRPRSARRSRSCAA